MNRRWLPVTLIVFSLTATLLRAQNHTEKGAVLGGVVGSLAGAAIGKQNGETTEGALIGGALGLITGAAIGNAKDDNIARARAYEQQRRWQMSRAVSISDVIAMSRGGVGDHVIISHIQQNGVQQQLVVSDVIALHQQGISEAVITAMQRAPLATAYTAPSVPRPAPVIVEQHHYVPPRYYHWSPHYDYHLHHHGHYHYHRPGLHWGITIGH